MLTTLPLECFVCREVITTYYFPTSSYNRQRHIIITTSLVAAATLLSLFTCDLGAVFELIGATSACALAYILPPLCYIKLSTRSWRTWAAGATAGFGVVVMVLTVFLAVVKLIKNEGGGKTCG
jgi:sodium-coupled neutral amino acid transporter 11